MTAEPRRSAMEGDAGSEAATSLIGTVPSGWGRGTIAERKSWTGHRRDPDECADHNDTRQRTIAGEATGCPLMDATEAVADHGARTPKYGAAAFSARSRERTRGLRRANGQPRAKHQHREKGARRAR